MKVKKEKFNQIDFLMLMVSGLALYLEPSAFAQETKTASTITSREASKSQVSEGLPYDIEIPRFENTKEGKEYLKKNGDAIPHPDEWGYPEIPIPGWNERPENIKKSPKIRNQKIKTEKTSFLQKIKDFFIDAAFAYDSVGLPPGFVNCRLSTAQTGGFFRIYFLDIGSNNHSGYDDPIQGTNRVQGVCDIFQEIAALINLDQTTTIPEITFLPLPAGAPPNALAAAAPYEGYSTTSVDNGTLHQHIVSGIDPNPGYFDAVVYTNFPDLTDPSTLYDFAWSMDSAIPAGLPVYHFKSVMRHELLHAMGFKSKLPSNITASGSVFTHNTFNEFMYEKAVSGVAQNRFFNVSNPLLPILMVPNGLYPSWMTNNQTVYQGKRNFSGATPDGIKPIYAPYSYFSGSSMSHFDDFRASNVPMPPSNACQSYPLSTTYTMNPFACPSNPTVLHQDEKEVLCHLGYQVDGVASCEVPTPAAMDDKITITNVTSTTFDQCIDMLTNDVSGTGSNSGLVVNDAVNESMPSGATVTYYPATACTGASLTSASGAKSVKITGTNTGNSMTGAMKIVYRIKNTSTSPQRISNPASIIVSRCSSDPDEYVCNGNFELGSTDNASLSSGLNYAFSNGKIPFWHSNATCDLTFKNRPSYSNSKTNLPYLFYGVYPVSEQIQHDMIDSGTYAAFCRSESNNYIERLVSKLKTNLNTGDTYQISFDLHMEYSESTSLNPPLTSLNIIAGLSDTCIQHGPTSSGGVLTNPLCPPGAASITPTSATQIINQAIPVRNAVSVSGSSIRQSVWTHVSLVFQPTQNHQYLVLGTSAPTRQIYTYYDNVSIKKISTPLNSISGFVYLDNVTTNGTRNAGEPGLDGITVKLFTQSGTFVSQNVSSSDPLNLGKYTLSVPNSTPATYYAVLSPENLFSNITEPVFNPTTLLSGYQHVKVINFSGGTLQDKNFGVITSTPTPPPLIVTAKAKMGCKSPTSGCIDLTVSGGTPPYSFAWSNGQAIEDPCGLVSGNYSVTVTDSSSPVMSYGLSVIVPPYSPVSVNGVVIPSGSGGNIDITATGNAPFTYIWSNGAITEDLTGVPPGTYTVTVTGGNKCSQTATFTIPQAQSGACCKIKANADPLIDCSDPMMNLGNNTILNGFNRCNTHNTSCEWSFTDPACCFPGAQGCGSVPGTACTPPSVSIPYPFTSLNNDDPAYQNLYKSCLEQAGASGFDKTNYYCCVTLSETLTLKVSSKSSCDGKSGAIDLSVTGGTAPYNYSWSDGTTTYNTQDLSSLVPGNYTIIVTDNSIPVQTASLSVTIPNIGPVMITGVSSPATAPNYNNGSINITVSPAMGYSFLWNKSASTWTSMVEDPTGLSPGSYTVTAKNKFGCKASKTFTVKKKFPILDPTGPASAIEVIKK